MLGLKEDGSISYCFLGMRKRKKALEKAYGACISSYAHKSQGFHRNGISIRCWKNAHIHDLQTLDLLLGFYSITDYKVFRQFYNVYKDDEPALSERETMGSFTQPFTLLRDFINEHNNKTTWIELEIRISLQLP